MFIFKHTLKAKDHQAKVFFKPAGKIKHNKKVLSTSSIFSVSAFGLNTNLVKCVSVHF